MTNFLWAEPEKTDYPDDEGGWHTLWDYTPEELAKMDAHTRGMVNELKTIIKADVFKKNPFTNFVRP